MKSKFFFSLALLASCCLIAMEEDITKKLSAFNFFAMNDQQYEEAKNVLTDIAQYRMSGPAYRHAFEPQEKQLRIAQLTYQLTREKHNCQALPEWARQLSTPYLQGIITSVKQLRILTDDGSSQFEDVRLWAQQEYTTRCNTHQYK